MHRVVKISKGLNINLKGAPVAEFTSVAPAKFYALMPSDFTRITPKVVVKPEDKVKAGDPLFVWPIPTSEMQANPQMQQNPGYTNE